MSIETPPEHTRIAWLIALGWLAIFEVWTLFNATPHDTLSETVWWAGWQRPVIVLVAGLLMGHFFGQGQRTLLPFVIGFVGGALFWTPYHPPETPVPGQEK